MGGHSDRRRQGHGQIAGPVQRPQTGVRRGIEGPLIAVRLQRQGAPAHRGMDRAFARGEELKHCGTRLSANPSPTSGTLIWRRGAGHLQSE